MSTRCSRRGSQVFHDRSCSSVMGDREAAQDDVAELVAAQLARRRHDPAHAERGADLLGVAAAARPGADHFLQRDDVGVDGAEHGGDALGTRAPVEAAAAMDVVGGDAQRRRARESLRYDSPAMAIDIIMARLKSEIEVHVPLLPVRRSSSISTSGASSSHKEPERGEQARAERRAAHPRGRGGAARSALPAVGRRGEDARRRAVEALRGSAEAGAARSRSRSRHGTSISTELTI